MAKRPQTVEIRAYNVGFGDCFLLSFVYRKEKRRHVLIDFGSAQPERDLTDIAKDIAEICGEDLVAVVATHRHNDHISGFAGEPGAIIRELAKNALIVQPWTEHPSARTRPYVQQLDHMQAFADAVSESVKRLDPAEIDAAVGEPMQRAEAAGTEMEAGDDDIEEVRRETAVTDVAGTTASRALVNRLGFIGQDNVRNSSALENLAAMSTRRKHEYLSFGAKTALSSLLPGVKVHVLGPPTAEQYGHAQELWQSRKGFWRMQALNAQRAAGRRPKPLFPRAKKIPLSRMPRESRWFVRRLRGVRAKQLLELVLIMDEALNNTSVILLFEIGKKKLLFPGDAQLESWDFLLNHPRKSTRARIRKLLADVDVYKVGHHGSRNATPKSLWNNFRKRSSDPETRMLTLLSTRGRMYASAERNTEVPRKTLVDALKRETELRSTTKLRKEPLFAEIRIRRSSPRRAASAPRDSDAAPAIPEESTAPARR